MAETKKHRQKNADKNTAFFLAFLPVLRSKTVKNQPTSPVRRLSLSTLNGAPPLVLEPKTWLVSMAQEGVAELTFRGRREQKTAFPPWRSRDKVPCRGAVCKSSEPSSAAALHRIMMAGRFISALAGPSSLYGAGGVWLIHHHYQQAKAASAPRNREEIPTFLAHFTYARQMIIFSRVISAKAFLGA